MLDGVDDPEVLLELLLEASDEPLPEPLPEDDVLLELPRLSVL